MKRILWNSYGFTLTELLVAAFFGLIVVATLYGFFREQLFNLVAEETKTATLEEARGALDIMVRELRHAGSGCAPNLIGQPTESSISAQMNLTGACEVVIYDVSGPTDTCPSTTGSIIRRNTMCLVRSVQMPTGSLFTYYDSSNNQLPPAPPVASIRRIKITFRVQETNPNPYTRGAYPNVISTLSSSVEFRN